MRSAGILMHVSSLPSNYGIGTLGEAAYRFIDFLERGRQTYWQILPLGPTGFGDSPYQSTSTFAGNPYFIDLERLQADGLLRKSEINGINWGSDPTAVDFSILYRYRLNVLRLAYGRFAENAPEDFGRFVRENQYWLEDYALFMSLKHYFGDRTWTEWEEEIRFRRPDALAFWRKKLRDEINFHCFLQYEFFHQWTQLTHYAHRHGIKIIGDIPIYVPMDSVDIWARPELFQLTEEYIPRRVAGCPPDSFNADGQLWGNPLYDWEAMKRDGYRWWVERIGGLAKMVDVIRIDHFRGFESYWSVPYGEKTARNGKWVKGPAMDLIRTFQRAYPDLRFIAEDLGFLTPEVIKMVSDSGFPGMKVLEFAFDDRETGNYLPHTYPRHCVCYTGTHDNETLAQWLNSLPPERLNYAIRYLGLNTEEGYAAGVIRGGMSSAADLFVAQMQDYLGLGAQTRMNIPGKLCAQNWRWRAEKGQITPELADRIAVMVRTFCRCPGSAQAL